jgi:hypothetical protein
MIDFDLRYSPMLVWLFLRFPPLHTRKDGRAGKYSSSQSAMPLASSLVGGRCFLPRV